MPFGLILAGLVALGAVQAAPSTPPSPQDQARIGSLLSGKPIRIIDLQHGTFDHRGSVSRARVEGCNLVLANNGLEPAALTVPLGNLLFVQGDDVGMVEITRVQSGSPSLIFTVGDAAYDEAMRLLTRAATGCGARLVGPPAIVSGP